MATASLASLRQPAAETLDASALFQQLLAQPMRGGFDPDAWHVMQERDNELIRSELLHGAASKAFVYSFTIKGKTVAGVSVIGARELAAQYKGIKSRIVATVEKRGALFIFRTFAPLTIETRELPALAEDDDFYECVMEVSDIKAGNTVEVRKKETRSERKQDGTTFERPHFDVIAESKAFRNGVLSVLPQSVIQEFKDRCLKAGNASAERTITQLRAAASAHAAKNGLAFDRDALGALTYDELTGLGGAAAQGIEQFKRSAIALGLLKGASVDQSTGEMKPPGADTKRPNAETPGQPGETKAAATETQRAAGAPEWDPSPEEAEAIRQREIAEAQGAQGQPAAASRRRGATPAVE